MGRPPPPARSEPARRRKRLARRLGGLLLVAAVPLGLVEVLLRVVGPRIPAVDVLLYDPKVVNRYDRARTLEELLGMSVLGFVPRTRSLDFVLNSRSLKTIEYEEEKPPDTIRILAIGNSFTYSCGGVPHDRLWHARLQAALQERTTARVEVLNFGVPAVGLEFERRLWHLEGSRLDADLVVVAFTVGGNFYTSLGAKLERTFSDRAAIASYAYRFARNVYRLVAARPPERWQERKRAPRAPLAVGGVPAAEVVPDFEWSYDPEKPAMSEEKFLLSHQRNLRLCAGIRATAKFESVREPLLRFHDDVTSAGVEFLLFVIPTEIQSNPALHRRVAEAVDLPERRNVVDAPQRFLTELCREGGIRLFDVLPALQAAGPDAVLYGRRNSHWNVEGNALAAEALLEYLTTPPGPGRPSLLETIAR